MEKNLRILILTSLFLILYVHSKAQNNCLTFDGSNDYIQLADLTESSSGTIEMWILPAAVGIDNPIFGNGSIGSLSLALRVTSNYELRFSFFDGSWYEIYSSQNSISTTEWTHIAVTWNSTSAAVYVNGVVHNRASVSTLSSATGNWHIAGSTISGSMDYFDGQVDEVRIWNDVRTESEIRQNIHQELTSPGTESNLVSYYTFNQSSGSTLSDGKGSNNGTLTNMSGNEWSPSPAMFSSKYCLDFDGTDDYVYVPASSSLNMNGSSFTIECWVWGDNSLSYNTERLIIECGNGWGIGTYQLTTSSDANLRVSFNGGMSGGSGTYQDWTDGKWHHVAGVFDNSNDLVLIYVDGKFENQKSETNSPGSANVPIYFASRQGSTFRSEIKLDEVRIWNVARSATEIRENMCKPLTGNESGLVAYYSFDNAIGSTLQDFSGNGLDGTLNNMDTSSTGNDWETSAVYNTWLNTTSTTWSTAANWSRGSVPTSTDNVGIYDWGGSDPIFNGNYTSEDLIIGSSIDAELSAGNSLTVNGNLVINGSLTVESNSMSSSGTGSLITFGSVEGDVKVERYLDGNSGGYYHFISAPISNAQGYMLSSDYDMYEWDEAGDEWDPITAVTALTPGKGYIAAYSSSKTLNFTGKVNTGNIDLSVTSSGDGYNVIGNPYPSRIDGNAFVRDAVNNEISGSLYFWSDDHSGGSGYGTADYSTWNTSGSTSGNTTDGSAANSYQTPNGYIESGQAFAVLANASAGDGTITFKNIHRVHDAPGQYYIHQTENFKRIWLKLSQLEFNIPNQILLSFMEEATEGYDRLYDGVKKRGNEHIAFYSLMQANDENYVIQGLPNIEETRLVPIGFYAGIAGEYDLTLDSMDNFPDDIAIMVEDLYLHTTYDLRDGSYIFSTKEGEFNDRFVLHLVKQEINSLDKKLEDFVHLHATGNSIILHSPIVLNGELNLYNALGQKLLCRTLSRTNFEQIEFFGNANTFYFVSVEANGQSQVFKVLLK
jgi:hypothetical protein